MKRLIAAMLMLGVPAMVMAAPQGDALHHDHTLAAPAGSAAPDTRPDMMARMKVLDDRVESLTADMNMFVGDMKVQAMAKLLNALVERHTMMRNEMMPMMRDMMKIGSAMNMESMIKGRSMVQENATPAQHEAEPGRMCAPDEAR